MFNSALIYELAVLKMYASHCFRYRKKTNRSIRRLSAF